MADTCKTGLVPGIRQDGHGFCRLGWRVFLVLMSVVYLADSLMCSFCLGQSPRDLKIAKAASQDDTESPSEKRPVTVPDFIKMTRLGDPQYNSGAPSKGLVAKFSPNGKRFAVVLRKGNLESNTNQYSLILFETADIFHSPDPRVLVSMESSSNRPAIHDVDWLDDNDTILFLGERPFETTQLYSFKCSSKELKKLTNHATNLSSFVAAASGADIVFAAENPELPFANDRTARTGIIVTHELLSDLIAGKYGGGEYDDHSLFVNDAGTEAENRITTEGRIGTQNEMVLSPDGRYLVLKTEVIHIPGWWAEYDDQFLKASRRPPSAQGARASIFQYELVDLHTGTGRPLLDAPIAALWSEVVWSPDSQSVIVSDMHLPLNTDNAAERTLRKTHTFLVEVTIPGRQFVEMSDEDLRLLRWDTKNNYVVCDVGRLDSLNGKPAPKAYFRKINDTWSRSRTLQEQPKGTPSLPDVVLDENMNQPPRIFAVDSRTGQKSLLLDLNPQFQALALARVEEISWKISPHEEVKGGLFWPLDYVPGKKYPLIMQTHGWDPHRFWMDGPYTTAFAAQALAGRGFFVLQIPDPGDWHLDDTPKEVPAAMAAYDGAIDFLDLRGLIDRDRIGITGFSRTFLYVTYVLTHSKHHFAAADLADGADYGYFQYMIFSNYDQTWAGAFDGLNGGAPFGKGLLKWLNVSPSFLMDRIETPLRIQTIGPGSLLYEWDWFTGLTRLGKPVEMIYIPDGSHVLEKPWDRLISQQGDVDWYCFWLKGEEDRDPAKIKQYNRWYNLRSLGANKDASIKPQ